ASGSIVQDSATVMVTSPIPPPFTPTGTVTYTFTAAELAGLTAPASWTVSADKKTWTETVTLDSQGNVPNSDLNAPLPAGTDYVFQARYCGDSNYAGSTSDPEPLTVFQPVQLPTVIYDASTEKALCLDATGVAQAQLGVSVEDAATVTTATSI